MKDLLNVASWDRIVRVVVGLALLYVAFGGIATGAWVWVAVAGAAIMFVTAALGFCPLYFVFKFRTLKNKLSGSR